MMFVGGWYRCGNGALRMRELNTLGPAASGLGLQSSVQSGRPSHLGCGTRLPSIPSRLDSGLRASIQSARHLLTDAFKGAGVSDYAWLIVTFPTPDPGHEGLLLHSAF